ncbi:TrwH protein [Denitromonas sp.]|nr:TrwH protein [Denitromonas sp.]
MKHLLVLLSAVVLTACATPPAPKAPDESNRVPINKVLPTELQENTK